MPLPLSMTGFGAAEGRVAGGALRVEVRTVNHRYFNLSVRVPPELGVLENELKERLRRDFERGHVSVQMRWVTPPSGTVGLRVEPERVRAALARLRELQAAAGQAGEIPLDLLARQPEVTLGADAETVAVPWPEVEAVVAEAARQCREGRQREGAVLAEEIDARLVLIEKDAAEIALLAPQRVVRERERLRAAVAQLLDGRPADEQRLAQEIAFLAERLDITEELVRLRAHVGACREALGQAGAVGKRLGFLAQELGREVNTIGSKANDAAIQHMAVAMKGELERFREQLENLE